MAVRYYVVPFALSSDPSAPADNERLRYVVTDTIAEMNSLTEELVMPGSLCFVRGGGQGFYVRFDNGWTKIK
jgi:hypothetical protein